MFCTDRVRWKEDRGIAVQTVLAMATSIVLKYSKMMMMMIHQTRTEKSVPQNLYQDRFHQRDKNRMRKINQQSKISLCALYILSLLIQKKKKSLMIN